MANPGMTLDIGRRLELAVIELWKDYGAISDIVTTVSNIRRRRDRTKDTDYPTACPDADGLAELGYHFGWYRGGLLCLGYTWAPTDKSGETLAKLIGAFRGWAQQTDLPAQINATTSAQAAETEIDVREVLCEGSVFDETDGDMRAKVLPVTVLARPSQTVTT